MPGNRLAGLGQRGARDRLGWLERRTLEAAMANPEEEAREQLIRVLDTFTCGVLAEPCGRVLTEFFAGKRALGKK